MQDNNPFEVYTLNKAGSVIMSHCHSSWARICQTHSVVLVLSAVSLSCDLASKEVSDWLQFSLLLPPCTGSTSGVPCRILRNSNTSVPHSSSGDLLSYEKREPHPMYFRPCRSPGTQGSSWARMHHQSHLKQKKGVSGIMQHNGEQKLQGHRWLVWDRVWLHLLKNFLTVFFHSSPDSHRPENTRAAVQGRRPPSRLTSPHPILKGMVLDSKHHSRQLFLNSLYGNVCLCLSFAGWW